jgi:hypothetical protein
VSLQQHLLNWPPAVARQVHAALFWPAADMHPEQFRLGVPAPLQSLAPQTLSKALDASRGEQALREWDAQQLTHRLALLPAAVIGRLGLNLGLVLHATALRQVVLRTELEQLAAAGMDEACWALVLGAESAPDANTPPLPADNLAQWPELLQSAGTQALWAISQGLPPSLGQRLRWKLPPHDAQVMPPPMAALRQAYAATVESWQPHWEACLSEAAALN